MLLDHALISQRYFYPRPGRPSEGLWEVKGSDGVTLGCYRRMVGAPLTLVHYHGNGEIVADYVPEMADELLALGVNLVLVDYRGYGTSSGRPQLARMLADVPAVFEALETPPERLVLFGRSLGSLYATEFASAYGTAGLVLESGICDLLERVLLRARPEELGCSMADIEAAVDDCFNQRAKLASYEGRLLALHARGDQLVLPVHAEQNVAAAAGPKKLVMFPRGDHNSIYPLNREAYLAELSAFFRELRSGV